MDQSDTVMPHCHDINDEDDYSRSKSKRRLFIVLLVCLALMTIEVVGGTISNSVAVMTDAAHLGTDVLGYIISIVAIIYGEKKATKKINFGYYRTEVIGALFSIFLIWIITGVLVYLATMRIINQEFEIEADIMIITSGFAIASNIIMMVVLNYELFNCFWWCCPNSRKKKPKKKTKQPYQNAEVANRRRIQSFHRSHSERNPLITANPLEVSLNMNYASAYSVSYQQEKKGKMERMLDNETFTSVNRYGTRNDENLLEDSKVIMDSNSEYYDNQVEENINIRAATIHLIGDVIQSVGVFIAALIIYYKPSLKIIDPITTYIFSVLVLITTLKILKDIIRVLMEGCPLEISYDDVLKLLKDIPQVRHVHSLSIWSLTMDRHAISAHVARDEDDMKSDEELLRECENIISQKYDVSYTCFQIERFQEQMVHCEQCRLAS
ncbi:hypothetical protein SNEBB_011381 [Seison nebaliae]|nr:hypothetical protein SNEBB_011381 [Seison nebaliae]